jgi:hypothetical protein
LLHIEHIGVRPELAVAQIVKQNEYDIGPPARAIRAESRDGGSRAGEAYNVTTRELSHRELLI